jgi:hypothetical protein
MNAAERSYRQVSRLQDVRDRQPRRADVRYVQVFGRRHHERRHALRRPASKKRQGTKSREVWGRVGSQRYGDLIFAPIVTVGAKLAPGDLDRVRKGSWKGAMGISVAA